MCYTKPYIVLKWLFRGLPDRLSLILSHFLPKMPSIEFFSSKISHTNGKSCYSFSQFFQLSSVIRTVYWLHWSNRLMFYYYSHALSNFIYFVICLNLFPVNHEVFPSPLLSFSKNLGQCFYFYNQCNLVCLVRSSVVIYLLLSYFHCRFNLLFNFSAVLIKLRSNIRNKVLLGYVFFMVNCLTLISIKLLLVAPFFGVFHSKNGWRQDCSNWGLLLGRWEF